MQMKVFLPLLLINFRAGLHSLNADIVNDANVLHSDAAEAYFDIIQVFKSCPAIYSLLFIISIVSLSIWLYSMITLRSSVMMPRQFINNLIELFHEKRYEAALAFCQQEHNYTAPIIAAGLIVRKHGPLVMMEAISAEGKRAALTLWQRLSLLNEIAIIAPMIGLLGTVIGLFFAFYDSSQSAESIASIFDGLGIAVGTTVVGLIVAILAMLFYTTLKFRIIILLNSIENEILILTHQVETDSPTNTNLYNP
jgi:biopolymer transport protein ExbB